MTVSSEYLSYVVDQLAHGLEVRTRRMFGGVGIYYGDTFFALVDDDQLYFKVSDATRADFISRGSAPFQPVGKNSKIVTLGYYTVPVEVLEDVDELKLWAHRALAVAHSAGYQRSGARARTSRKKQ